MRKLQFDNPYFAIETLEEKDVLYNKTGEYSVIIEMDNIAEQLGANPGQYESSHMLFSAIIKSIGNKIILQKSDVIYSTKYAKPAGVPEDFLSEKYHNHFVGRDYRKIRTFITLTFSVKKKSFFTHSDKEVAEFHNRVEKVFDILDNARANPRYLRFDEINTICSSFISMTFNEAKVARNNFKATETEIEIGKKSVRCISLIDNELVMMPNEITAYRTRRDIGKDFPVALMTFLHETPFADTVVYNQIITVPPQTMTMRALELKKKRHSSIPDAANVTCMEDIDQLLENVARNGSLLVNSHYTIVYKCDTENVDKVSNYLENKLFEIGITPNLNSFNQWELYNASFIANASKLKDYDNFLTTSDTAVCFFLSERLAKSEDSTFQLYFADRQGSPVAIDTYDKPMQEGRINNRNQFVLGPSGSGKSFFTNEVIRQLSLYDTDIVVIDTGHSYSGINKYLNGTYISYSDESPITMNPFIVEKEEYNEEKREFLKSMIGLLWKGASGEISQTEQTVISTVLNEYYAAYWEDEGETMEMSFNGFYDFSMKTIPDLVKKEEVSFEFPDFRFILKRFYRGGEYDKLLNSQMEQSLFNEQFIVFEIDSIKEHKVLFPIVTIIIMDVFLQKMRLKSNRKTLIIEEAWKAIASPMMAGYILYLYKTVRKFNGQAIVVTQDLDDIIGNAIVKDSIISNSDTIVLLDQTKFKDNYERVANLLNLNPVEQNKIFTINNLDNKAGRGKFKEVYIKRGSSGEVYGVEVSLEQYIAFSTERNEKEAFGQYLKIYDDFTLAMEEFVKDYKTSKLPFGEFCMKVNSKTHKIETLKLAI